MTTTKTIASLTNDDILSVYSGRDGACCCGCAGKHSYNPNHREEAGKSRGYEIDDNEVNMGMVTRVLNAVNANPADVENDAMFAGHISLVVGRRLYIAYLRAGVEVAQ